MGDKEGGEAETLVEFDRLSGGEILEGDVAEFDQLVPGTVGLKKLPHSGHGVNGDSPGTDDFAPEVEEPGVMTDVGVGGEDAVDPGEGFRWRELVQGT